jgi:hypothetical protein
MQEDLFTFSKKKKKGGVPSTLEDEIFLSLSQLSPI